MKKVILFSFILSILSFSCGDSQTDEGNTTEENTTISEVEQSEETIDINGVNHFIRKIGSGEPIVVLHGGPGIFHDHLVPHFKQLAQDYQVIFYDQRGCGRTAFPSDTSSINLETYVEDLEAIRNHLGIEKMNLLGHSWGAILALKYGVKYSDKLSKLILVAPGPSNTEHFDQTFANMQHKRSEEDMKDLITAMMSSDFEKREEKTFRKVVLLGDKSNLHDQSRIEELYEPLVFTKETANNLMIVNSLMERTYFNFEIANDSLKTITCPAIIMLGDMDNVPFASAQSIQDNLGNCKLKVFKKCGQYPFFEAPEEFNKELEDFLDPEYVQ